MSDVTRHFEVEPAASRDYDIELVPFGETWYALLRAVEQSLEKQFDEVEAGDREWKDVAVQVGTTELSVEDVQALDDGTRLMTDSPDEKILRRR